MRKITEIPATIFKSSKDINRQYRVAAYCALPAKMDTKKLQKTK